MKRFHAKCHTCSTCVRHNHLVLLVGVFKLDGVHLIIVNQPAAVGAALSLILLVAKTISLHLTQHGLSLPPNATFSERRLVRVIPRSLLSHPLVDVHPELRAGETRDKKIKRRAGDSEEKEKSRMV